MTIDILSSNGRVVRCSNCRLRVTRYVTNNNIALEAICTAESTTPDGEFVGEDEPWSVMTVNPSEQLPDDMICVKDYSEGAGNLRTLVDAGLVEPTPVRLISSGFVNLPVCKLTEKGREWVAGELAKVDAA